MVKSIKSSRSRRPAEPGRPLSSQARRDGGTKPRQGRRRKTQAGGRAGAETETGRSRQRPPANPRRRRSRNRRPVPSRVGPNPRRPRRANGSTRSAAARRRASRACATCSAARAPISPRWPISACRCRRASPSRPRSAPISTATAKPIRRSSKARSRPRSQQVGKIAGRRFGDRANPLLVSVRSGARASMPGMMDTVLNLGLNDVDRRGAGEELRRPPLRL